MKLNPVLRDDLHLLAGMLFAGDAWAQDPKIDGDLMVVTDPAILADPEAHVRHSLVLIQREPGALRHDP